MTEQELLQQTEALQRQIGDLPPGTVCRKTVRGRQYYYHRWYENGRRLEKFVPAEEAEELIARVDRRKTLEEELRAVRKRAEKAAASVRPESALGPNIRVGTALRRFAEEVRGYGKRGCFRQLREFLDDGSRGKVLILCGLQRTGKTTLLCQALLEMDDSQLDRAAFVRITPRDSLAMVGRDLRQLEEQGCRYVFLDGVTQMEDFVEGAALFPDVFAACGMKIVLSGSDTLALLMLAEQQLYDRCILLETSVIPFFEYRDIMGIDSLETFLGCGGVMSPEGPLYRERSPFATREGAAAYVNSAIVGNIRGSLLMCRQGDRFRRLRVLCGREGPGDAVERVLEDLDRRFLLEALSLGGGRTGGAAMPAGGMVMGLITERFRKKLERQGLTDRGDSPGADCLGEVTECLDMLCVTRTVETFSMPEGMAGAPRRIVTQPGLRCARVTAQAAALLEDQDFSGLSLSQRTQAAGYILELVKNRLLEDAVLLETGLSHPKKRVIAAQFGGGVTAMVVCDPETSSCELYELRHGEHFFEAEPVCLNDPDRCAAIERRFGEITGKYVLYRGEDCEINRVRYRNAEGYLRALWTD